MVGRSDSRSDSQSDSRSDSRSVVMSTELALIWPPFKLGSVKVWGGLISGVNLYYKAYTLGLFKVARIQGWPHFKDPDYRGRSL